MIFVDYLNIFDDIVFTMENDYSGCQEFFDRAVACSYRDKLISLEHEIDTISFVYPISKGSCVDKGEGVLGKGHLPHIYIPWSLKHLYEDVDLKEALLYIKAKDDKGQNNLI